MQDLTATPCLTHDAAPLAHVTTVLHAQIRLFVRGDVSLLRRPCVAIVGARTASEAGRTHAAQLARSLVAQGIVVVSGLARGIDVAAHTAAIEHGGRTLAVIGTPLERAYPIEHASLQAQIGRDHLVVSPWKRLAAEAPASEWQRQAGEEAAMTEYVRRRVV